jgi:hypothetical protein
VAPAPSSYPYLCWWPLIFTDVIGANIDSYRDPSNQIQNFEPITELLKSKIAMVGSGLLNFQKSGSVGPVECCLKKVENFA